MRSLALSLVAITMLAGCSSSPPRVYAPLRYDYLTPLRLNVASVTVETRFVPGGSADLNGQNPAPLIPTLTQMAQDRLQAVGSSGRAVFVIKDASLARIGDGINGSIDVELDVYAGGGTRAAFAEARVSRRRTGDIDDMPSALYDMTKQLMDAMNIEFEYQVRRSLKDWLAPSGAAPAPVQQQALPPPPGAAAAPAPPPGASMASPMPMPMPQAPTYPSPTMSPPPGVLQLPSTYSAPSTLPPPRPFPTPGPGQTLAPLPTQLVPPSQP